MQQVSMGVIDTLLLVVVNYSTIPRCTVVLCSGVSEERLVI